jgi:hypothetical protein
MTWIPAIIKDFAGISRKRSPALNACDYVSNLDLRDISGDMVAPNKISQLYAKPYGSGVFIGSFYCSDLTDITHPDGAEVTVYLAPYQVTPLAGTVAWDKKMMGIWIRPYWDGVGTVWVDDWNFLNEVVITTLASVTAGCEFILTGMPTLQSPYTYTIYNVTRNVWDIIYLYDLNYYTHYNGHVSGDIVILFKNYYPTTYHSGAYSATINEVSEHKILNDIRLGFGGKANRLGVAIGYRQSNILCNGIFNYDQIILNPHLPKDESDNKTYTFGLGVIQTANITDSSGSVFPQSFGGQAFLAYTVVLDGFNEFIVGIDVPFELTTVGSANYIRTILISPKIRFGTANKRITSIKIYLAGSDPTNMDQRMGDYFLVKEIPVANATGGLGWEFDSNGVDGNGYTHYGYNLVLTKETINPLIGQKVVDGWGVTNAFEIDYAMYKGASTAAKPATLDSELGYTGVQDYALDWAEAIVTNGRAYVLNPYIDKTYKNIIMASNISGAGASAYDVITPDTFFDEENRDGNDIIGMEVLSNTDILLGRKSSLQALNLNTGVIDFDYSHAGLSSKRGAINYGDSIFLPSQNDAYEFSSSNVRNLTEDTIRDLYRKLTPEDIIGIRDNYGDSIWFSESGSGRIYLFIPKKGFITYGFGIINLPMLYNIDKDGNVIYLGMDYNIYKVDNTTFYNPTAFSWTSIPLDVALFDPKLKTSNRFVIKNIEIGYESPKDFAISFLPNGSNIAVNLITIPKNYGLVGGNYQFIKPDFYSIRLNPGRTWEKFQIYVSGGFTSSADDQSIKFRIKYIKIMWKPIDVGYYG